MSITVDNILNKQEEIQTRCNNKENEMTFKTRYRNLEMEIIRTIRDMILNSNSKSQHINDCKCVCIDIQGFTEVCIVDDQIRLIDDRGYHTPALNGDCPLEYLIDIIEP